MAEIIIKLPSKTAPGFLKRNRRILELQKRVTLEKAGPEAIDELIDFLSDYVSNVSKEEAKELLWDASEEEFYTILGAFNKIAEELNPKNV